MTTRATNHMHATAFSRPPRNAVKNACAPLTFTPRHCRRHHTKPCSQVYSHSVQLSMIPQVILRSIGDRYEAQVLYSALNFVQSCLLFLQHNLQTSHVKNEQLQ